MFSCFRRTAVVPPAIWDGEPDPEPHEGLGVRHLEPVDVVSRLAALVDRHEGSSTVKEVHLPLASPRASLAVTSAKESSIYGGDKDNSQVCNS